MNKSAALGSQGAFPLPVHSLLSSMPCEEQTAGVEKDRYGYRGASAVGNKAGRRDPGVGWDACGCDWDAIYGYTIGSWKGVVAQGLDSRDSAYFAVFMNEQQRKLPSVTLNRRGCYLLHADS